MITLDQEDAILHVIRTTPRCRVQHIANAIGYSSRHTSDLVRQAFGHTPHALIQAKTLEHLLRLVSLRAMTVRAMARELGYPQTRRLEVMFRRAMGCSIGEWRRRCNA